MEGCAEILSTACMIRLTARLVAAGLFMRINSRRRARSETAALSHIMRLLLDTHPHSHFPKYQAKLQPRHG